MASVRTAKDAHFVAERLHLEEETVREVIHLLEDDNTVPFIARYRKEQTKGLDPTVLRQIEALHQQQKEVKVKVENTKKKIGEQLTNDISRLLDNAQSSEEVDDIYAPYKKGNKKTLAARAKDLGLEPLAQVVLTNPRENIDFTRYVKQDTKGLNSIKDVTLGVQHILADVISKDSTTLDTLKDLVEKWPPVLESTLSSKASKDKHLCAESKKYQNYHNFQKNVAYLKAHQVLAINRAEALKILTVKITLPAPLKHKFVSFSNKHWLSQRGKYHQLLSDSVNDSFERLLAPTMCRRTRSALKKRAEIESTSVFTQNLYSLLLTTPIKGKSVLALDPGYSNGCKMALMSPTGAVLETGIIFPTGKKAHISEARTKVVALVKKHSCETIAIGNGVACRETEMFIAKLIRDQDFSPLEVVYCIVSENGASVYSASKEAIAELPGLDISLRGAVSIGRRLQDPLLELVKIEPKHLGIGMYQHDTPEHLLRAALDGVMTDCVSLVGADINAAGVSTLKRLAGLNEKKANAIIEWRTQNKRFVNRSQLLQVKGIGKKSYEQCVGFVKILSEPQDSSHKADVVVLSDDDDDDDDDVTTGSKRRRPQTSKGSKRCKAEPVQPVVNPLDRTLIHPESYDMVERLLEKVSLSATNIGMPQMVNGIDQLLSRQSVESLSHEYSVGVSTVELVLDGLRQSTDHDIRSSFEKPIFKKCVILFEDLTVGMHLSGRVTNVTTFGAFVDCGVGRDGLMHNSQFNKRDEPIFAGDVVEVKIANVDRMKKHFQLLLESVRPRLRCNLLAATGYKPQ